MTSVSFYRAIIVELERKRMAMGISMDMMSELMGVAERSYAKMIHPDTPSGRQANWDKLQKAIDVLFADGFEVVVRAGASLTSTGPGTKRLIRQAAAHYDRRTQREVMREIGLKGASKGGCMRARKLSKKRRSEIAKIAANARWIEKRGRQIAEALK